MHEQEYAIVQALVPVAWADGHFADKEREMLEALLESYGASEPQKAELRTYAATKRTLEDIPLQDLSASDRRTLLHHAVILSFADGHQDATESKLLRDLAEKLHVPADEATSIVEEATARAKKHLHLLG